MQDKPEVGTPEWWLDRLVAKLVSERATSDKAESYYSGDHPLPFVPKELEKPYREMLDRSKANFCRLVVDAAEERLQVEGFRLSSSKKAEDDLATWQLWQANGLDSESKAGFIETLVKGRVYISVWRDDRLGARIWFDNANSVTVEHEPGNPRNVAAALKLWSDDWTGSLRAQVTTIDGLFKFTSDDARTLLSDLNHGGAKWERWEVEGEEWPIPLPEPGIVPVFPIYNSTRLVPGGRSELADIMVVQDRINKGIIDGLMASETSSYRQKWATGLELERDPETNEPKQPFEAALDRLWISEDAETTFGSFDATELGPFIEFVEMHVRHLALLSRTPRHYLTETGQAPSGDAIKSAETGLVAKVRRKQVDYAEPIEAALRYARKITAEDADELEADSELIWRHPEYRSDAELADALVKESQLGVPVEALWEKAGYSPQQIRRFKAMQASRSLLAGLEPATLPEIPQDAA